jgi:hypothetical protein
MVMEREGGDREIVDLAGKTLRVNAPPGKLA